MLEPAKGGAGSDSPSRTAGPLNPLQPHSSFTLVGKGEKSHPDCGEYRPLLNCQWCQKVHFIRYKCRGKWCSRCYTDWVADRAVHITSVLEGIKRNARVIGFRLPRTAHVTISPHPRLWKEVLGRYCPVRAIEILRDYALAYMNSKTKFYQGALILHLFRPNWRYYKERGEERREGEGREDEDLEEEKKKWEWILSKENWWEYVEFSPHWHFVGFVGYLEEPKKGEDHVYKLIPVLTKDGEKYTGIKSKEDLHRIVRYLLSHASGVCQDHQHVYWWVKGDKDRIKGMMKGEEIRKLEQKQVLNLYKVAALFDLNVSELVGKKEGRGGKGRRKPKLKCKVCGGVLAPFDQNIRAFLRAWLGVHAEGAVKNFRTLRRIVFAGMKDGKVPEQIGKHVMEALDIQEYMQRKQTKMLDEGCPLVDPEYTIAEVSVRERERLLKRLGS